MSDPERLWKAVDQSPVSIVITDPEGRIQYVNQNFVRCTGHSAEEALGKKPQLLKSGHHPKEFYAGLWGTILAGQVWSGEICNRRKSGEFYWESAVIAPVRNAEGVTTNFVAIKQEITQRKRMEGQLAAVESKFRRVVERMEEGFLEALVGGIVTLANPAAARLLGYERPEELVGQPFQPLLIDPDEMSRLNASWDGKAPLKVQLRVRRRDGQACLLDCSLTREPGPLESMPVLQFLFRQATT